MRPLIAHSLHSARANLRGLLFDLLIQDSDVDAFISDYFPRTYRCFTIGIDRITKITWLLDREDHDEIRTYLFERCPNYVDPDKLPQIYNQKNQEYKSSICLPEVTCNQNQTEVTERCSFEIKITIEKISPERLIELLKILTELTEDPEVALKSIKRGSIILGLECSITGYERLRKLFDAGLLENGIGLPVSRINLDGEFVPSLFQLVVDWSDAMAQDLNELGIKYCRNSQLTDAEQAFKLAITLAPYQASPHYNLGNLLCMQKQRVAAEEEYNKAILCDPEAPEPRHNLAELLRLRGDFDAAEKNLRLALQYHPNEYSLHWSLGNLLVQRQELIAAESAYREVIRCKPERPDGYYALGIIYERQGHLDKANLEYRKALQFLKARRLECQDDAVMSSVADSKIYLGLSRSLIKQKKFTKAEHVLRQAMNLLPNEKKLRLALIELLLSLKNRAMDAAVIAQEILDKDPNLAVAHSDLGASLFQLGDKVRAEAAFLEALRLDPYLATAHLNFGILLASRGDEKGAEKAYRESIRVAPQSESAAAAHANLGVLFALKGDLIAAEIQFDHALRLNPNCSAARANLQSLRKYQGKVSSWRRMLAWLGLADI